MQLDRELDFAIRTIYDAGKMALSFSNAYKAGSDVHVQQKAFDGSPVTAADKAVNSFLVDNFQKAFPNDLIVAEESENAKEMISGNGRTWFIDPIDGTQEFLSKNGEWAVMIGLTINGEPSLGLVYQPENNILCYASKGKGAYKKDSENAEPKRLFVDGETDFKRVTIVNSRSHFDPIIDTVCKHLGITKSYPCGSLGVKMVEIACKKSHLYFNTGGKTHLWDTCGPEVILSESGGKIVLIDGNPINYKQLGSIIYPPFVACTANLLPKILAENMGRFFKPQSAL